MIKSYIEKIPQQEIRNDMDEETKAPVVGVDQDKLAALKARVAEKEKKKQQQEEVIKDSVVKMVEEKTRSIRFGVMGSGQSGGKICESFFKLGYPAVAINTATQDLASIEIPQSNKLHLDFGLGGAAKDMSIGYAAAEAYSDVISSLIQQKLGNEELILFCTSLGGGSGAGSVEIIVDIINNLNIPVAVITVLPQTSDDTQVKNNALQTLGKLVNMVKANKIVNLIVVDNAKIETIYSDVNPFNFFKVSNQAIVEPIDVFNTFSKKVSPVKPLDSNEFGKLFTDGQGLTIYGSMKVTNYEAPEAIAESIVENLSGNLLASGFDIQQARYVGFMLIAPKKVWSKIPSVSLSYAETMIDDVCKNPTIFKGIYEIEDDNAEDCITVYSMFSGLGLPTERIDQLKTETKEKLAVSAKKDQERASTLKVDFVEQNVSAADTIRKKIQLKQSAFGQMNAKMIEDRRKK